MAKDLNQNASALIAKRHLTNESAQLEVYGKMGKLNCRMSNLSATGAFFQIMNSTFTPKVGDFVQIRVLLRKLNRTHILHGQIIWSKGMGLGISFIKLPEILEKLNK